METANVTIVVVPRDHFSDTREALEGVYENSNYPFELVYVDGGSPKPVARYLRQQAEHRGLRLLRTEHYLSPNRAAEVPTALAAGKASPSSSLPPRIKSAVSACLAAGALKRGLRGC